MPRQVWDQFNGDYRNILLLVNASTVERKTAFSHSGSLFLYTFLHVPWSRCTISCLFWGSLCFPLPAPAEQL